MDTSEVGFCHLFVKLLTELVLNGSADLIACNRGHKLIKVTGNRAVVVVTSYRPAAIGNHVLNAAL